MTGCYTASQHHVHAANDPARLNRTLPCDQTGLQCLTNWLATATSIPKLPVKMHTAHTHTHTPQRDTDTHARGHTHARAHTQQFTLLNVVEVTDGALHHIAYHERVWICSNPSIVVYQLSSHGKTVIFCYQLLLPLEIASKTTNKHTRARTHTHSHTHARAHKQANNTLVPREINRKYLALHEELGNGEYGAVWKAGLDESEEGGPPEYVEGCTALHITYTRHAGAPAPPQAAYCTACNPIRGDYAGLFPKRALQNHMYVRKPHTIHECCTLSRATVPRLLRCTLRQH